MYLENFTYYLFAVGNISLVHSLQIGSEAHSASYTLGTGGSFPWVKRQGHEADHSSLFITEVKCDVATPPLPHSSSWRGV
jgi:hypothetical protein